MKYQLLIFSTFIVLCIACSITEPIFNNHEIKITVDAEVTESWIKLDVQGLEKSAAYIVKRNSKIIFESRLTQSDTLIHDENLEPTTTYNYLAYAEKGKEHSDSISAIATTMDTTDYSFVINSYYLDTGEFTDCRIWDKDSFWVTGWYYKKDSLGNWESPYTILSFENNSWKDIEVKCRSLYPDPIPLTNVQGFWAANRSEVWFIVYDIYKWTGGTSKTIWGGGGNILNNIFGFDKNEIYVGGSNGRLLRVTDLEIKNIEISEYYNIRDIWGDKNRNLVVGVSDYSNGEQKLLLMENDQVVKTTDLLTGDYVGSFWFNNLDKIFIGGQKINILNRNNTVKVIEMNDHINFAKIRGTAINNIFAVTYEGKMYHFNGKSWTKIYELPASFRGLCVTENLVVAAGRDSYGGYVVKIEY